MYDDIWASDMKYDEIEEMCRVAWSEKFNYLWMYMTKNKKMVNIVFSVKAEMRILKAFAKVNLFKVYEKKQKQSF